jgi:phosphoglycerate-specific signal transduction histidine kinase
MKLKYLVLKLEKQIDIDKLRDKLNEIIDGDNSIGIVMKWKNIAEILIKSELEEAA